MNRRNSITLIARALLFSVVILLAGNGTSYGQQSDIDNVRAAIEAYHAALEALALSRMEPLWVQDTNVMLINPRHKSISVGWEAVRKGWESEFDSFAELKITQAEGPYIQVKGDVAWPTGIVNAVIKLKTGVARVGLVLESDVFEKRGGAWLLTSHTASSRPQ